MRLADRSRAPATAPPPLPARQRDLALVLALGAVIEVALIAGLVAPLWLFGPTAAITTAGPVATRLGLDATGLARFAGALLVWLAGAGAALLLTRRPLSAGARRALVLLPALFALTLLGMLPASSRDVYHYIMEGRIVAVYGGNPMQAPPAAVPHDPLFWIMSSWEDEPSRYGPLFILLAGGVARVAGENLVALLLGFKLLAVAALFATAALTARTAACVRPGAGLPAYVFVAWNPLALYEAAANAHNDLLMVAATALALRCMARRQWQWALPALALGVLTKYIVVLLAPLVLIEALRAARQAGDGWRNVELRRVAAGSAVAVALAAALYAPFWEGTRTLTAVTAASGGMINSPGWLLRLLLELPLDWERARPPVVTLLSALFLAGYAALLGRAWRRPAGRDDATWLATLAFAVLALELATLAWWLWPWYALWLLPAAALLRGRREATLAGVITGAALLAYLPLNYRELFWGETPTDAMANATAATLFLPPLALAGWWAWRGRGGAR